MADGVLYSVFQCIIISKYSPQIEVIPLMNNYHIRYWSTLHWVEIDVNMLKMKTRRVFWVSSVTNARIFTTILCILRLSIIICCLIWIYFKSSLMDSITWLPTMYSWIHFYVFTYFKNAPPKFTWLIENVYMTESKREHYMYIRNPVDSKKVFKSKVKYYCR